MNYLRKHLATIIAISIIIIGLLSVANLIKFGYLTADVLVKNKDLIDVVNTIFTTLVILASAVVSYFSFFRGRIFSNNANIELSVTVHKIRNDAFLHVINANLKNEGSFPIWEPVPTIIVYPHKISNLGTGIKVDFWESDIQISTDDVKVVNPMESEQFIAFHYVPKSILVLTYVVQIKSRNNVKWTKAITISNQVTNG